jgi:hypothetical protein
MTGYTGTALYLAFKGTALNADYRSFDDGQEIDLVDASAGADANKTYLTALKDGTADGEFADQTGGTAATALYNLCVPGAEGTLEWGPEGTATNKPRHYVNAIVKSRKKGHPYNEHVMVTISWQFSGAITDGAYT